MLVDVVITAAAAPLLAMALYLFVLALLSRRTAPTLYGDPELRFDIVVPAHDEESGVESTVRNLLALSYPPHLRRVLVVADNCTDRTAEQARAAGAIVLERHDEKRVGKGYALEHAFDHCLRDGFADAIVVVDADTLAQPNLLRAFSARLVEGATALQARYAVRNPDASWRTRLMAVAFCLFHDVRSLARERVGLSAGLRGNGMCFRVALLRDVAHVAHSLVEDVEYGVHLGLAGHRVGYADDAVVLGEMVSSEAGSRTQRQRWERGRSTIARCWTRVLIAEGLRRRDAVLLDLAMDLIIPPLSVLVLATGLGLIASGLASVRAGMLLPSLYAWVVTATFLTAYVVRGVWLSGTGLRGWLALACAPIYVAWKLALPVLERTGASGHWIRTERERPRPLGAGLLTARPRRRRTVERPGAARDAVGDPSR